MGSWTPFALGLILCVVHPGHGQTRKHRAICRPCHPWSDWGTSKPLAWGRKLWALEEATWRKINRSYSELRKKPTGQELWTKAGKNCIALFPKQYSMEHAEDIQVKRVLWSWKFGKHSLKVSFLQNVSVLYFSDVYCESPVEEYRNFSTHIQSGYLVPGIGVDTEDKEMNKKDKVSSLKESGEETWQ